MTSGGNGDETVGAGRTRRVAIAVAFVAALFALVAFAVTRDSSPSGPILPSAAGPPGTPLGDGYEVADGTTLIGDPIPEGVAYYSGDEPVIDEGWTANTLVDDGVVLVEPLEHYLRQAEQNGLVVQRPAKCTGGTDMTVCTGFARSEKDFTTLTVYAMQGAHAGVLSGHVVVSLSTQEGIWHTNGPRLEPPPLREAPDPAPWTPSASERDALPTTDPVPRAVVVEKGSRLAGPVRLVGPEFGIGGIYAVLEVTGDPDVVLGRYVEQLTRAGLQKGPDAIPEDAGGATLTKVGLSEAGGDQFSLTLVERPSRPTWLIIKSGHD